MRGPTNAVWPPLPVLLALLQPRVCRGEEGSALPGHLLHAAASISVLVTAPTSALASRSKDGDGEEANSTGIWPPSTAAAAADEATAGPAETSRWQLQPFSSVPSRQLQNSWVYDWLPGIPDLMSLGNEVVSWAEDTTSWLIDLDVVTFRQLKQVFYGARTFLRDGLTVVRKAFEASRSFAGQLVDIFTSFKPLQKFFTMTGGLFLLLTSPGNMAQMGDVLMRLLNTSDAVLQIGSALSLISSFMEQVRQVFGTTLGKLVGGGRRLAEVSGSYSYLLDGLPFVDLNVSMSQFVEEAQTLSRDLGRIDAILRPLASELSLPVALGSESSERLMRKAASGRRLLPRMVDDYVPDVHVNVSQIREDQDKYEGAVMGIVPAWQGLESLVMRICDGVHSAIGAVENLKCRALGEEDDLSSSLLHAGYDCWEDCGRKSGYCLWCGSGGACCRSDEPHGPEECSQVQHTGSGFHECVLPDSQILDHRGENCWEACGKKSGSCAWCGDGNACCRSDAEESPEECEGVAHTREDMHECIIPVEQTRVGFADFFDVPGMSYVEHLVEGCTTAAEIATGQQSTNSSAAAGTCPVEMLSAALRLALVKNAGIIGWVFALLELVLQNPALLRIVIAFPVFLIGCGLCFYGFGLIGITYFFQGFLGGLFFSSVAVSIAVAKVGICRGHYLPHCEPRFLLGMVFLFGTGTGFLSWKVRRTQEVLYGANLGATMATLAFIFVMRSEIIDGLSAKDKAEQLELELALAMVGGAIAAGGVTFVVRKPLWIVGTSVVGGALLSAAGNIAFGTTLDMWDLLGWGITSVLGMAVQSYLFLCDRGKDQDIRVEEESRLLLHPDAPSGRPRCSA